VGYSGFGPDTYPISNGDMTVDTDLSGKYDMISQLGATGNPHLSYQNTMLTNGYVVGDLNLIVYFGTFSNPSLAKSRSVNRSIGTNLDVIINLNDPHLRDFDMMALFILSKAKSITADDGTTVHNNPPPKPTAVQNDGARIDKAFSTNGNVVTDVHATKDRGPRTDTAMGTHACQWANRHFVAKLRPGANVRGGVYPDRNAGKHGKELCNPRESQVRVAAHQQRSS
jgi:hypothetical protein